MILIVSGEGPTDIGCCDNEQGVCKRPEFRLGPMAAIIDILIEEELNYSPFDTTPDLCWYVSEAELSQRAKALPRKPALRGKKGPHVETGFFFINAWMLGIFAKEKELELDDASIAILFRDCDGQQSSPPNLWQQKKESIESGFQRAEYFFGTPMIPKPKSEAWILCSARNPPNQNCESLEDISGNDNSPNSAKAQLDQALGHHHSAAALTEWIKENVNNIDCWNTMPSFNAFRTRVRELLQQLR